MRQFLALFALVALLACTGTSAFAPQQNAFVSQAKTSTTLEMTVLRYGSKKKDFKPGSPLSSACAALGVKPKYNCKKWVQFLVFVYFTRTSHANRSILWLRTTWKRRSPWNFLFLCLQRWLQLLRFDRWRKSCEALCWQSATRTKAQVSDWKWSRGQISASIVSSRTTKNLQEKVNIRLCRTIIGGRIANESQLGTTIEIDKK